MPIQLNLLERTAIFTLNLVPGVMLDLGGALAFQTLYLAAQLDLFTALADPSAVISPERKTMNAGHSLLKPRAGLPTR